MARQFNPSEFKELAGPEIIERFLEEDAGFLNVLGCSGWYGVLVLLCYFEGAIYFR